jgi:8-oxo-dGTP diphosphatase
VGTRQRLAAYALIIDDAGRVLLSRELGRRRPSPWLLPGGGVEHGEHPEQAVVREVMEEAGLRVSVGELREVLSDVAIKGRRRWRLHTVRLVYQVTVDPAGHEPPGHLLPDGARWCTPEEWQAMPLEPFTVTVLGSASR